MTAEERSALIIKKARQILRARWTNWWPTALEMARKEVDRDQWSNAPTQ